MVDQSKLMEARTFEVGDVLGRSFAIWAKNFLPFGLITLIVSAPLFLLHIIAFSGALSPAAALAYVSIVGILAMALGLVATGAVTYGVVMQMRQQPVSMGVAVQVGLSRVLAVLGVAGVIILLTAVPIFLMVLISPALALIGVIIMFVVMLTYWVAVPVAVVEKLGVGASLARSAVLTRGSKGSIFLLLFIVGILSWVVTFALQSLLSSLPPMMFVLVTTAIQAFFVTSLGAVVNAVGYQALRTSKEGASLEDIAKVFD